MLFMRANITEDKGFLRYKKFTNSEVRCALLFSQRIPKKGLKLKGIFFFFIMNTPMINGGPYILSFLATQHPWAKPHPELSYGSP